MSKWKIVTLVIAVLVIVFVVGAFLYDQSPTAVDEEGVVFEEITTESSEDILENMERGEVDPDFVVEIYDAEKAWDGTTLLSAAHDSDNRRLIEVNMLGEIIWEYKLPEEYSQHIIGFEVDPLDNGNILMALSGSGVFEINREGEIVWSYETEKVSHDADRLENGNTLFVYGAVDHENDVAVTEITPEGEVVWEWRIKDHFDYEPYNEIFNQGWGHTNAATRMDNGHTLISIRNFDMVVEVDEDGEIVNTIEGIARSPHDPAILENGNILVMDQRPQAHSALEINPETEEIVWEFPILGKENFPARDCNRLPNGNTLIVASTKIVEVTKEGEVVWEFRLSDDVMAELIEDSAMGFFKAERLGI